MDAIDLNSIKKTELLTSTAAKDKIMIKPKRTSTKQSRKKSYTSPIDHLPSLNEENRSKPDAAKESSCANSFGKVIISEETPPSPISGDGPPSHLTVDADSGVNARKLNLPLIPRSAKENNGESLLTSPSLSSPVALTASSPLFKATTPTSPNSKFPVHKIVATETQNRPGLCSPSIPSTDVSSTHLAPNCLDMKMNNINRGGDKISQINETDMSTETPPVNQFNQNQKELDEIRTEMNIKSKLNQFQTPAVTASKFGSSTTIPGRLPLKLTVSDSVSPLPIREENKVRQWGQNKTIASVTDVPSSLNTQKANSNHILTPWSNSTKTQECPTQNSVEKTATSPTTLGKTLASGPEKLDNIKLAYGGSQTLPAHESSWTNKKKNEKEILTQDGIKSVKTANSASSSVTKSVFMTSNNLGRKQDNSEMTSNKNQQMPGLTSKKGDNSESKFQSADTDSRNVLNSKVSSNKTESSEMNISEPNSVKTSRNLFASSSKSNGEKANVFLTLSGDRFKSFSSSPLSSQSSNTLKAVSNTNQGSSDSTASGPSGVKSSEGDRQIHYGSATLPSAKNHDASSTFQKRGMNFKGSSIISPKTTFNVSLGAVVSSAPNKTDDAESTPNPEKPGATSLSASSVHATHVYKPATTQSPSVQPSQTPLATSPTFPLNAKSIYGESVSKPLNNISKAEGTASTQSSSKPATTTSTTTRTTTSTSASTTYGMKSSSYGQTSSMSAVNTTSVSGTTSDISISSSSTTSITSSSSPFSKPYSSVSLSSAFKPPSSTTSSQSKNVSLKSTTLLSTTKSTEKMATTEKLENKTTDPPIKVPIWRSNLMKKEVNIEIIDKSASTSSSSSSNTGLEALKKCNEKDKISDLPKKNESLPNAEMILQMEIAPGKPSKVLSMVKNFQNFKVPS